MLKFNLQTHGQNDKWYISVRCFISLGLFTVEDLSLLGFWGAPLRLQTLGLYTLYMLYFSRLVASCCPPLQNLLTTKRKQLLSSQTADKSNVIILLTLQSENLLFCPFSLFLSHRRRCKKKKLSVWDRFAPSGTGSEAEAINPELLGSWSMINRPRWRMALLVQPGEVSTLDDPTL